jgi:hypothetical protein
MNLQIQGYNSIHKTSDDFEVTFELEREARAFLAEVWSETKVESSGVTDKYLDELLLVANSSYFSEYVYVYCRRDFWAVRPDLKLEDFQNWSAENPKGHKVENLAKAEWDDIKVIIEYCALFLLGE